MHLRCFFLVKIVAIYALLVCKIFGAKIRSCKFFDKSQVCVHIVALLVLRLLAHTHTHAQTLQMLRTQMKHKHTNKYKHNVLNVMFCGAQRAGCAHIESTYAACNSSYAHISRGRLSSHVVNIIFDKTITI